MPDFRARVRDSLPAAVPPPAGWIPWAGLMQDIRHGARVLRRRRGITLVEMLTMALGIGATTALFSVTYGVLLKPLPWPDSDRLVRLTETRQGHEPRVRGTGLTVNGRPSIRRSKRLVDG